MKDLLQKSCVPCEGGVDPLSREEAEALLKQIHAGWQLAPDAKSIRREFKFRNFYHSMGFLNAVAFIANTEDHHPDVEIGYGYCRVRFNTHAIDGLSENDFICAAKIDRLTQ